MFSADLRTDGDYFHIVRETAIFRDPPIYSFTRDRTKLTLLNGPTRKHVVFLRKYKDKQFFCGYNILTEGVFVTRLSSNVVISV